MDLEVVPQLMVPEDPSPQSSMGATLLVGNWSGAIGPGGRKNPCQWVVDSWMKEVVRHFRLLLRSACPEPLIE